MIYIKENPKQTYSNRPEEFFLRLSSIKNIKIVDIDVNTFELINKCLFCACITGTAGFEAIHLGKPTLTFGHAFYNNIEGVFSFAKELDIDKILNYKVDQKKLTQDLIRLNSKLGRGVILLDHYSKIYKNFDKEQNIKDLTTNFTKIINHIFKKNA